MAAMLNMIPGMHPMRNLMMGNERFYESAREAHPSNSLKRFLFVCCSKDPDSIVR